MYCEDDCVSLYASDTEFGEEEEVIAKPDPPLENNNITPVSPALGLKHPIHNLQQPVLPAENPQT